MQAGRDGTPPSDGARVPVGTPPGRPSEAVTMNDVTRMLSAIEQGEARASELLPLVYDELRRLAARRLARESPGQTLQATALVHEAYLRLVGSQDPGWNGRGHFFAAAAEAMRRILVDHARHKKSLKGGEGLDRVDLDRIEVAEEDRPDDLIALDEALSLLARDDPQTAELVKLRYFCGLSNKQAADALGISPRTADFRWAFARAWLFEKIKGGSTDRPAGGPSPMSPA
jgi:RNA polymerase sigma factor (TIGR02999 family)